MTGVNIRYTFDRNKSKISETAVEVVADFRCKQIWLCAFKLEQYDFLLLTVLHLQAFIGVYTMKLEAHVSIATVPNKWNFTLTRL